MARLIDPPPRGTTPPARYRRAALDTQTPNPRGEKMEIISRYTEDQAIEDGQLIHPYPERWPWLLIAPGVHAACERAAETGARTYAQALVPLLMDCIMAVQSRRNPQPPIILEDTVADTVWIMPNDKGGMTVMQPAEY